MSIISYHNAKIVSHNMKKYVGRKDGIRRNEIREIMKVLNEPLPLRVRRLALLLAILWGELRLNQVRMSRISPACLGRCPFPGDTMVILGSVLPGVRQVYVKRLTQNINPVRLPSWQAILGVPMFLLLSLSLERWIRFRITPEVIYAVLYQGLVVAGFSFILLTTMLRRYMASRLGVFAFATPLFGVFLCYLLLAKRLSMMILVSGILVGVEISVVNKR